MRTFFLSIIGLMLFISCKTKTEIQHISANELQKVLKQDDVQLIDVRSKPGEGSIENSLKISVGDDDFLNNAIQKLDKSKPVYVYCKGGGEGLQACEILHEKGYKVYNLEGGYKQWKKHKKEN